MAGPIEVTRRQAVRGQIDTAIELVFFCGDPVSAHVLASAASEVLRGLAKHHGHESFDVMMEKYIRPDKIKFWQAAMNRHYNFFKHADRDAATDVINFNPETTILEIFACVTDYGTLFKISSVQMAIFRGFMATAHPDAFLPEYLEKIKPGLEIFGRAGATPFDAAAAYLKACKEPAFRALKFPDTFEP